MEIEVGRYPELRGKGKARVKRAGGVHALEIRRYDAATGEELLPTTVVLNLEALRANAEVNRQAHEAMMELIRDCEGAEG